MFAFIGLSSHYFRQWLSLFIDAGFLWYLKLGLMLLLLSHFSHVLLCATPQTAAHRLPIPGILQARTTEVGCHFLLQGMKVKSESEVAQSCPTLRNPMDCSLPDSFVHGIFPGKSTGVGCHFLLQRVFPTQGLNLSLPRIVGRCFIIWATREAPQAILYQLNLPLTHQQLMSILLTLLGQK